MSEPPPPDPRDRILAAALTLFCAKGFGAVGTQELCAAAGVLKGTLYHFFPSKLDVALAALERYGERVRAEFAAVAAGRGSAAGRLGKVFAASRREAEAARAAGGAVTGCLHGNLTMELAAAEPRVRAAVERISAGWVAALEPIVHELAPADPPAAARAVLAFLHGAVLMAKAANDPAEITRLGRRVGGLLAG